jgi:hypothetical protein
MSLALLRSIGGLSLVILILSGCGGSTPAPVKLVPVEGTVLIEGKPAEKISVWFLPDSLKGNKGPRSTAVTDADGKFVMMSDTQASGAVAGWHIILLDDYGADRPRQGEEAKNPSRISLDYSSIRNTSLFEKIPEAGVKDLVFDLKPAPKEELKQEPKEDKKVESKEDKKGEDKKAEPKKDETKK